MALLQKLTLVEGNAIWSARRFDLNKTFGVPSSHQLGCARLKFSRWLFAPPPQDHPVQHTLRHAATGVCFPHVFTFISVGDKSGNICQRMKHFLWRNLTKNVMRPEKDNLGVIYTKGSVYLCSCDSFECSLGVQYHIKMKSSVLIVFLFVQNINQFSQQEW